MTFTGIYAGDIDALNDAAAYTALQMANATAQASAMQDQAAAEAAWLQQADAQVSLNAAHTLASAQAGVSWANEVAAADRALAEDAASASDSNAIADNAAAALAATAEAGFNVVRGLAIAAADAARATRDENADYTETVHEMTARYVREHQAVANELTRALQDAVDFVTAAIAVA